MGCKYTGGPLSVIDVQKNGVTCTECCGKGDVSFWIPPSDPVLKAILKKANAGSVESLNLACLDRDLGCVGGWSHPAWYPKGHALYLEDRAMVSCGSDESDWGIASRDYPAALNMVSKGQRDPCIDCSEPRFITGGQDCACACNYIIGEPTERFDVNEPLRFLKSGWECSKPCGLVDEWADSLGHNRRSQLNSFTETEVTRDDLLGRVSADQVRGRTVGANDCGIFGDEERKAMSPRWTSKEDCLLFCCGDRIPEPQTCVCSQERITTKFGMRYKYRCLKDGWTYAKTNEFGSLSNCDLEENDCGWDTLEECQEECCDKKTLNPVSSKCTNLGCIDNKCDMDSLWEFKTTPKKGVSMPKWEVPSSSKIKYTAADSTNCDGAGSKRQLGKATRTFYATEDFDLTIRMVTNHEKRKEYDKASVKIHELSRCCDKCESCKCDCVNTGDGVWQVINKNNECGDPPRVDPDDYYYFQFLSDHCGNLAWHYGEAIKRHAALGEAGYNLAVLNGDTAFLTLWAISGLIFERASLAWQSKRDENEDKAKLIQDYGHHGGFHEELDLLREAASASSLHADICRIYIEGTKKVRTIDNKEPVWQYDDPVPVGWVDLDFPDGILNKPVLVFPLVYKWDWGPGSQNRERSYNWSVNVWWAFGLRDGEAPRFVRPPLFNINKWSGECDNLPNAGEMYLRPGDNKPGPFGAAPPPPVGLRCPWDCDSRGIRAAGVLVSDVALENLIEEDFAVYVRPAMAEGETKLGERHLGLVKLGAEEQKVNTYQELIDWSFGMNDEQALEALPEDMDCRLLIASQEKLYRCESDLETSQGYKSEGFLADNGGLCAQGEEPWADYNQAEMVATRAWGRVERLTHPRGWHWGASWDHHLIENTDTGEIFPAIINGFILGTADAWTLGNRDSSLYKCELGKGPECLNPNLDDIPADANKTPYKMQVPDTKAGEEGQVWFCGAGGGDCSADDQPYWFGFSAFPPGGWLEIDPLYRYTEPTASQKSAEFRTNSIINYNTLIQAQEFNFEYVPKDPYARKSSTDKYLDNTEEKQGYTSREDCLCKECGYEDQCQQGSCCKCYVPDIVTDDLNAAGLEPCNHVVDGGGYRYVECKQNSQEECDELGWIWTAGGMCENTLLGQSCAFGPPLTFAPPVDEYEVVWEVVAIDINEDAVNGDCATAADLGLPKVSYYPEVWNMASDPTVWPRRGPIHVEWEDDPSENILTWPDNPCVTNSCCPDYFTGTSGNGMRPNYYPSVFDRRRLLRDSDVGAYLGCAKSGLKLNWDYGHGLNHDRLGNPIGYTGHSVGLPNNQGYTYLYCVRNLLKNRRIESMTFHGRGTTKRCGQAQSDTCGPDFVGYHPSELELLYEETECDGQRQSPVPSANWDTNIPHNLTHSIHTKRDGGCVPNQNVWAWQAVHPGNMGGMGTARVDCSQDCVYKHVPPGSYNPYGGVWAGQGFGMEKGQNLRMYYSKEGCNACCATEHTNRHSYGENPEGCQDEPGPPHGEIFGPGGW